MPTLPLYTPQAAPNASRHVRAPGGYQAWTFHVYDRASTRHVRVVIGEGFAADADYLRRYRRYRRHPTRVAPPLPSEYMHVEVAIYDADEIIARENLNPDGLPQVIWGSQGAEIELNTSIAHLRLRPRWQNLVPQSIHLQGADGSVHELNLSRASIGDAEADLTLGNETTRISGIAYHDHRFGTAPIACGFGDWLSGHALFDDAAVVFCGVPRSLRLIEIDRGKARQFSLAASHSADDPTLGIGPDLVLHRSSARWAGRTGRGTFEP